MGINGRSYTPTVETQASRRSPEKRNPDARICVVSGCPRESEATINDLDFCEFHYEWKLGLDHTNRKTTRPHLMSRTGKR